jgi:hypothetical protein
METVNKLIKAANSLDDAGFSDLADSIDKIAKNIIMTKRAQFVGIQGYAIRNSRCWGNCYRQKRTRNPKMAAQEVWTECYKEYLESINNDTSGWEKYAETSIPVKYASYEKKEKVAFAKNMRDKISSGISVGQAFVMASEENDNKYSQRILDLSKNLVEIVSSLEKSGKKDFAKNISDTASELIKEAQFGGFWNRMKGIATQPFDQKARWLKNLEDIATEAYTAGTTYIHNRDPDSIKNYSMAALKLQRAIAKNFAKMNEMFKGDQSFAPISLAMQKFTTLGPRASRTRALDELLTAIRGYQSQSLQSPAIQDNLKYQPQTGAQPQTRAQPLQGIPVGEIPPTAQAVPVGQPMPQQGLTKGEIDAIVGNPVASLAAMLNNTTAKEILRQYLDSKGFVLAYGKKIIKTSATGAEEYARFIGRDPKGAVEAIFRNNKNIKDIVDVLMNNGADIKRKPRAPVTLHPPANPQGTAAVPPAPAQTTQDQELLSKAPRTIDAIKGEIGKLEVGDLDELLKTIEIARQKKIAPAAAPATAPAPAPAPASQYYEGAYQPKEVTPGQYWSLSPGTATENKSF